eukprot:270856-Pleurochrysis_carterae.AAC.1
MTELLVRFGWDSSGVTSDGWRHAHVDLAVVFTAVRGCEGAPSHSFDISALQLTTEPRSEGSLKAPRNYVDLRLMRL